MSDETPPECFGKEFDSNESDCVGEQDPTKPAKKHCRFVHACQAQTSGAVQPDAGVVQLESGVTQQVVPRIRRPAPMTADSMPKSLNLRVPQVNTEVPPIFPYLSVPEPTVEGESAWLMVLRTVARAAGKAVSHTFAHLFDQHPLGGRK